MHVQEAIHSRRTAHSWQDTPVPEEVILKGLEAAQMAPCHRLTWPWRFTLPGPVTRKALFEIGIDLKAAKIGGEVTEEFRQLMVAKMGNPALGTTEMGRSQCWASHSTCGVISAGPVAQFKPKLATGKRRRVAATAAISEPTSNVPVVSTVTETMMGNCSGPIPRASSACKAA